MYFVYKITVDAIVNDLLFLPSILFHILASILILSHLRFRKLIVDQVCDIELFCNMLW